MGFRHLMLLALAGLAGESAACADWLEKKPASAGQLLAEASGVFVARIGKLQEQRQGDDPFAPPARVVAHFDVLEVWKGDPPVGGQLEWSLTSCDIPVLPGGIYAFHIAPGTDTGSPFRPARGTRRLSPANLGELDAQKSALMGH